MKKIIYFISILLVVLLAISSCSKDDNNGSSSGMTIDHHSTNLAKIPADAIKKARTTLRVAYGHNWRVGGQIVDGMRGLIEFKGISYNFSNHLRDRDSLLYLNENLLGHTFLGDGQHDSAWAVNTRDFLSTDSIGINVVMWSWGDEVSTSDSKDINLYLSLMSGLEKDFPDIKFVYMTGHVDGNSLDDNLHYRNEQIRKYCREKGKILYDIADIESYDPDGKYFGDKNVTEDCHYDKNGSGDGNWATEWQSAHSGDWFNVNSGETEPLSINQKAFAAWWLWARLAGWGG